MSGPVRVTRLMEYEFQSVEQALAHLEVTAVPATGSKHWGSSNQPMTIRSAVIGPVFGEMADRIHTALAGLDPNEMREPGREVPGIPVPPGRASVLLFKPEGKFYTEETWAIPDGALGPFDMHKSPDFRRIGFGSVLVVSQEPWGYPHLFPGVAK